MNEKKENSDTSHSSSSIPLNKTIGLRLLRYVFGCYFAVALMVTSAQLVSEYIHVKDGLFKELVDIGETLEGSLAKSIWNYNKEQVQATLIGINKISVILTSRVTDPDDELFAGSGHIIDDKNNIVVLDREGDFGKGSIYKVSYSENNDEKKLFEYKFPIHFIAEEEGSGNLVGYCYIYADYASIIDRVSYSFLLIIINSIIKTVALWFIFLYFTKRIIANPLETLTHAAKALDPNNTETFRKNDELDKIFYSGHEDELNQLTGSFLKMRLAIIEKIDFIEQQNLTLEQRVKERTAVIESVNSELKHLSLHDPLTGLPNRSLFHNRLEHLIKIAKRDNFCFLVGSIDFRKFKEINDSFGHQAGDEVLKVLSKRMLKALRDRDTIARMGGDEFAILIPKSTKDYIHLIGERIVACAYKPIIFQGESIFAGINIGFSIYPDHSHDSEILFNNADIAMYQAKRSERGISIFTQEVGFELKKRDIIVKDLEKSIENNQLSVFYQPIVCSNTHTVDGVEALLRWKHPDFGFIPPLDFITIAERSNMIKTITEWVINQALSDGEIFHKHGHDINMAINISGRLISDITYPDKLEATFNQHNFPKEKIVLELTESSTMKNPQQAMEILLQIKKLGVNLAIDDFGTGYSSFSYLTSLPVNKLKIDRSFLTNFNDNNQLIVETIITLAHKLNLKVVVEGVEIPSILSNLENLNCDYIQGYYFSRPLPMNELLRWLSSHNK